ARSSAPSPKFAGAAAAWRRSHSSRMAFRPSSGVARQPAEQAAPVALVAAHVFGVVIENALAEARQQHVGLAVADLAGERKRQLPHVLQGLLAGPRPGPEAVGDEADRELAAPDPADRGQALGERGAGIEIECRWQDRH